MPETYGTLRAAFMGPRGVEVYGGVVRELGDATQTIFDRSLYPDDRELDPEFEPVLALAARANPPGRPGLSAPRSGKA